MAAARAGDFDTHSHGYAGPIRALPHTCAPHFAAVEPSVTMRAQRPDHAVPAIDAIAEHLPCDDESRGRRGAACVGRVRTFLMPKMVHPTGSDLRPKGESDQRDAHHPASIDHLDHAG